MPGTVRSRVTRSGEELRKCGNTEGREAACPQDLARAERPSGRRPAEGAYAQPRPDGRKVSGSAQGSGIGARMGRDRRARRAARKPDLAKGKRPTSSPTKAHSATRRSVNWHGQVRRCGHRAANPGCPHKLPPICRSSLQMLWATNSSLSWSTVFSPPLRGLFLSGRRGFVPQQLL